MHEAGHGFRSDYCFPKIEWGKIMLLAKARLVRHPADMRGIVPSFQCILPHEYCR